MTATDTAFMRDSDPIDALFAGMNHLGPGSDVDTLHVLHMLPRTQFDVVVDAGCGSGRQTLALARALRTTIHAVDLRRSFLEHLEQRAREEGLDQFIQTHLLDMKNIPSVFPEIDLLWAEGAAYNIGFECALETWAKAISPNGFAVVSELCWLRDTAPPGVKEFFASGYPQMKSVEENIASAENAGYDVRETYTLPTKAWVQDYYELLQPRAQRLAGTSDPATCELALATVAEIEIFSRSEGSYGYVFFVLERKSVPVPRKRRGFSLPFFFVC